MMKKKEKKIWEKITFALFGWERKWEENLVEFECFLSGPTKIQSSQIREKLGEKINGNTKVIGSLIKNICATTFYFPLFFSFFFSFFLFFHPVFTSHLFWFFFFYFFSSFSFFFHFCHFMLLLLQVFFFWLIKSSLFFLSSLLGFFFLRSVHPYTILMKI